MNALKIFEHERFGGLRIVDRDGEPWFVAKDVAKALGYIRTADAVREHCKGVGEMETPSPGGKQMMKIIPEADLFRLIMHSKLPDAEAFQDWVVKEVLPSIRKHGAYMTDNVIDQMLGDPRAMIRLLNALADERDRRMLLEEREAIFGNRTPYGEISKINGLPRTEPVHGYLRVPRTLTTTTVTTITDHQSRLFDWE